MSLSNAGAWAAGVWAPTVWADGVWYETPAPATGGGVWRQQFLRRHQRAALSGSFSEPDLFNRLSAEHVEPAVQAGAAYAVAEYDEFAALAARQSFRAALRKMPDEGDALGRVAARRGLPSRAVLAWFLEEVA